MPGSGSGPVILLPVLDRPRLVLLGWALLSFALFGVVTLAVVQGWGPVDQFDDRGDPAADWAIDSGLAVGTRCESSRSASRRSAWRS